METRLLEVEAGLRWYVIRAKLRKETVVERRIGDLGLEVFLPWLRCRRRVGSRYQWVLSPLFPDTFFAAWISSYPERLFAMHRG